MLLTNKNGNDILIAKSGKNPIWNKAAMILNELLKQAEEADKNDMALLPLVYLALTDTRCWKKSAQKIRQHDTFNI